ncbi:hypothetical protein [Natrialba magadii]|uniref:hypothetical protein n=1 Tax=Natrialba magadii TaxID=13769 RepID=UPI00135F1A49|nr:hypothetical protein [Natrialba magadii]
MRRSRRDLLSASGLMLAALAGCVDSAAVGTEAAGEPKLSRHERSREMNPESVRIRRR